MAILYDGNKVILESVVYEDTIVELRDFLQQQAPQSVTFNFEGCDDAHMGVLQLIMAYKKAYVCEMVFAQNAKIYKKVLEGFDTSENHCY